MSYLIIFFTSLLVTIFFTPYLISFFTKVNVVDNPDGDRRINENTIPRMGGIIVYFMAMVSIIAFFNDLTEVRFFIIASLIIVTLGIVDDIIGVNWDKKFLFQAIAAIFLLFFINPFFNYVTFFGLTIPHPFDYFLIFILAIGTINSINLMDGLDGLVSGFSLLVVSVTFLIGYYYGDIFLMILSISLMGSLIGFLKFNAYPARIFLGDTGSQTLGFFLITVSLLSSLKVNGPALDLTFPVILLGVPIVDTLKVIVVRLVSRKNIFLPDKSHMHHMLFGMKIRHKVTVFILQGFSFLYAFTAIYYLRGSEINGIVLFVLITLPFLFVDKIIHYAQQHVHPTHFRHLYSKIPEVFITIFSKILLPVFSVIIAAVLAGLIPIKSAVSTYIILLSIAFIILLLMYSVISYQKNKHLSEILVFVNLIMFLFYSSYSQTMHNYFHFLNFVTPKQLLVIIILPLIVFFLFFRERILQKKVTFLSGIDLIILVFIVLLAVSSGLLPSTQIASINLIVFHSFLLYVFYKVVVSVKENFQKPLYYSSFIIPLVILTVLLLRG